jgi:hypothetical protein
MMIMCLLFEEVALLYAEALLETGNAAAEALTVK